MQHVDCPYPLGQLIPGLTYEQYAAVGGLRAGTLKKMMRSPAHYRQSLVDPPEDSDALEFGSLFHSAIENGEKFLDTYVVEPEFTGKTKDGRDSAQSGEAKAKRAAWWADQKPGVVIVRKNWVAPLTGMLKSCLSHRLVGNMMKNGLRETSLFVEDPETGEIHQCKYDLISEYGHPCDFKSTRDASPGFFMREIFSTGSMSRFYALAAAHYTHVARVANQSGLRGDSFTFIAVEKTPPYGIMTYPLDIGCLGTGEQYRAHLSKVYAECRQKNIWPSYPETAHPTVPPAWVRAFGENE